MTAIRPRSARNERMRQIWWEEVVPLLCWGAFLVLMVVSVNGLMGGGA